MSIFGWLRKQIPTNWSPYKVGPFAGIRLKDGSEAEMSDLVMRRRLANGTWEYRRPMRKPPNILPINSGDHRPDPTVKQIISYWRKPTSVDDRPAPTVIYL